MKAEVLVPSLGVGVASIALIITAIQVYLNGQQLRRNTEVNRGNFWLKLEEMSYRHDDIHLKLRPKGDWTGKNEEGEYKGPGIGKNEEGKDKSPKEQAAEWAQVEDYMGWFEHCKIMLDRGLIDATTFEKIFGYRLGNIVGNPVIVKAKLIEKETRWGWEDFIKLLRDLGKGVNLSGADLRKADDLAGLKHLRDLGIGVNLSGADLRGAELRGADLRGANLSQADLSNADVTDEQLAEAKTLQGATMPDGSKHP